MFRWFKRSKDEAPLPDEGVVAGDAPSTPDVVAEGGEVAQAAEAASEVAEGAPESTPAEVPEVAEAPAIEAAPEPEGLAAAAVAGIAAADAASSESPEEAAASPAEPPADPFATSELDAIREALGREAGVDDASQTSFAEQDTSVLPPTAVEAAAASAGEAAPAPLLEQSPSEIDLGPEGRGSLWVWLGLIFGMLVAAGAIGYAWWYTTARPIPTPAVIGKQAPQAVQQINDAGLRLGRVQLEATDTAEVGDVIDQEPQSATKLKPGDLVSIVVVAEPQTTEVPTIVGRSRDDAFAELATARLSARIVESYDTSVAAGLVISQIPTAGADLKPGTLIAVAVSKGPAPTQVRMPKLIGLRETDAEALLKASSLRGTLYRSYNASITVGEVYAQMPLPDSSVAYGSSVQYLVSNGAGTAPVTVPTVVGTTRKVAEARLKDRGLKASVKQTPHLSVPKGQVISQLPAANSKVARGATIGLLISRGSSNTTAVPDFSGLSSEEASRQAQTAGYKATIIDVPIPNTTVGMVYGQWPAPAVAWPRNFPVMIVTSRLP